jgi:ribosomal-protein-alanine N-acetyltransferase
MIREATPEDVPYLRAIQQATLAEPWQELLEPAIGGPPLVLVTADSKERTRPHDDRHSDEPVGYAIALPEGATAYLAEFAIAPARHREGLGSTLMDALCRQLAADGFERVRLVVQIEDERARAFYSSHDYRVRSLVPEQYESGDGLLLVRSL